MNNKGKIAIGEILILVVAIFAFTWMIGEVNSAGASDPALIATATGVTVGGVPAKAGAVDLPKVNSLTKIKTLISEHPLHAATALVAAAVLLVYIFGNDEAKNVAKGIGSAIGYGIIAGQIASKIEFIKDIASVIGGPWAVGIAVAAIYLIFFWKNEKQEVVMFTCYPWDAIQGGAKCDLCNKQELPCSEYQCRSLGQNCRIVNPGTDQEKCVAINRNDIEYPIIEAWDEALPEGYKYTPDNAISPPNRGVKIINTKSKDGCVPAWYPLTFGVKLNEVAKCKIDNERKSSFDAMISYFNEGPLALENHTFTMSLPGTDNLNAENLTIQNDGEYSLYVKCADANNNSNTADFVFKFCVDKGPDLTAPKIVSTSILNNSPIKYEQSEVKNFQIYTDEPSTCKWSHLDQSYDSMENEFEQCSTSVMEVNAQMLYSCTTTLTGLNDRTENKFYFKCKDKPLDLEEDRNVNEESHFFTLIGTEPLYINDYQPNGTDIIRGSTNSIKVTLKVETSAGYKDGEATCSYSKDENKQFIEFYNTNSYLHSQDLYLEEGTYTYFIKCIDLGGNEDKKELNFAVESDTDAPLIARAYYQESNLKLITNEKAECYYDTTDCNFLIDEGIAMSSIDAFEHFTNWNTESSLFVKCKDEYGNQPAGNGVCSIIVRATNFQTNF